MDKLKLLGTFLTVLLLSISTNAATVETTFWGADMQTIPVGEAECMEALHLGELLPISFTAKSFQPRQFVYYNTLYWSFVVSYNANRGTETFLCHAYEMGDGISINN